MPRRIYSRAYASVRFAAVDLDPLDVTLRLRLPADHTHRRGEPRLTRSRRTKRVREYSPYSQGMWSMSSEAWVDSPRLATHIEWLLDELEPKAADVRALLESGVEGDIFCYSLGRSWRSPALPRRLRERAAALGLPIDIDHYPTLIEEEDASAEAMSE
jgi:hypothetical protein